MLAPDTEAVDGALDHAAGEDGERRFERQVHPDGDQHGGPDLDQDHGETHEHADDDQRPGHLAADNALGQGGHQAGLRGGQLLAAEGEGPVQQHQGEVHDQGREEDPEDVPDLHLVGGASQDVPDLQVLEHLAGDGRGDAHDGGDTEHGGDPAHPRCADDDHEQGGDDQGRQGQAGDRVVGGADRPDQVARNGGEEKAGDCHDDGGQDGRRPAAGEDLVDEDHQHEGRREARQDDLDVEVLFEAGGDLGLPGGLLDIAHRSLDAGGQVLSHPEKSVPGPDEHPADGDRADDEFPDVGDHVGPVDVGHGHARPVEPLDELRAEEIHQQGGEETPGQDTAREVESGQAGPDDVADPDVGRIDARTRNGDGASRAERGGFFFGAQAHEAGPDLAHPDDEVLAGGEELDNAQDVEEGPEPHGLEEELGALAAFLPGLVDLGRGHRFREDEVGVGDHDPAEEGHEEDPQQAADEHQGRGLDVGLDGVELQPGPGDEEGRDGEDGPGGHRLPDGADGPGDVLFQDGPPHDPENGHADDGRRVGGGDGHAGPQAEVGVGRPEDDGQHEPDEQRPEGEFPQVRLLGDVRLMAHRTLLAGDFPIVYLKSGTNVKNVICFGAGIVLHIPPVERVPT